MKFKTGRKVKGSDGKLYNEILTIELGHDQQEQTFKRSREFQEKKQEHKKNSHKKRAKGGLRKCSGHKFPKTPIYSNKGQCNICGGYNNLHIKN